MFGFSFKKSKSTSSRVEVSDMKIEVTEIDVEAAFEGAVKKVVQSDVQEQILRFLLVKIYGEELVKCTEEAIEYCRTSCDASPSRDELVRKFPGAMLNNFGSPSFGDLYLLKKLAGQLVKEVLE